MCACICMYMHVLWVHMYVYTYARSIFIFFSFLSSPQCHSSGREQPRQCWGRELTMHHKVKCKCQHLGPLNGPLFLQQFHEVSGFLLSSSLCSKRTVSAGWVAGQCPLLGTPLWSYEGGCLDFLGIMCGRHKIQASSWRR